jgi:signal transduction histidine kinase
LRNCLWDLRNLSLDERNLETAIRKTLAPHTRDTQIEVSFDVPRTRLSDNTAHAILRIIRELVLNAVRHGRASVIRIVGGIDGEFLRFSVIDNGCGFDPDNCSGIMQGHFGLEGIRERAGLLSGALTIESSPGKGTAATVTIPLPPAGNAIRKEP